METCIFMELIDSRPQLRLLALQNHRAIANCSVWVSDRWARTAPSFGKNSPAFPLKCDRRTRPPAVVALLHFARSRRGAIRFRWPSSQLPWRQSARHSARPCWPSIRSSESRPAVNTRSVKRLPKRSIGRSKRATSAMSTPVPTIMAFRLPSTDAYCSQKVALRLMLQTNEFNKFTSILCHTAGANRNTGLGILLIHCYYEIARLIAVVTQQFLPCSSLPASHPVPIAATPISKE